MPPGAGCCGAGVLGRGATGVPTGVTVVGPGKWRTGTGEVDGPGAAAGGRTPTGVAGVRTTAVPGCTYTGPCEGGMGAAGEPEPWM